MPNHEEEQDYHGEEESIEVLVKQEDKRLGESDLAVGLEEQEKQEAGFIQEKLP